MTDRGEKNPRVRDNQPLIIDLILDRLVTVVCHYVPRTISVLVHVQATFSSNIFRLIVHRLLDRMMHKMALGGEIHEANMTLKCCKDSSIL